jgi:hypothetical protein
VRVCVCVSQLSSTHRDVLVVEEGELDLALVELCRVAVLDCEARVCLVDGHCEGIVDALDCEVLADGLELVAGPLVVGALANTPKGECVCCVCEVQGKREETPKKCKHVCMYVQRVCVYVCVCMYVPPSPVDVLECGAEDVFGADGCRIRGRSQPEVVLLECLTRPTDFLQHTHSILFLLACVCVCV